MYSCGLVVLVVCWLRFYCAGLGVLFVYYFYLLCWWFVLYWFFIGDCVTVSLLLLLC